MIPRSARLLSSLIEAGEFTADELATTLLVSREVLDQYIAGTMVMPLSRQMVLANFAVARSKTQKRAANALHGQVVAAVGFKAQHTTSHSGPPPTWDPRRRR